MNQHPVTFVPIHMQITSGFSYLSLYVTFKPNYFGPTTLLNPGQIKIPNKPLLIPRALVIFFSFFLAKLAEKVCQILTDKMLQIIYFTHAEKPNLKLLLIGR